MKPRKNKHGHSRAKRRSREYCSWRNMIQRCTNPKAQNYAAYGGRGITVCQQWRDDFRVFLSDMGIRHKGMSLNRIDNNGHYCKANCEWSTSKEQRANQR